MHIGGMFQRAANKLGPLICRDSYDALTLAHLGEETGRSPVLGVKVHVRFTHRKHHSPNPNSNPDSPPRYSPYETIVHKTLSAETGTKKSLQVA